MKNTVFAVLLAACFVSVAVAADRNPTIVARPDVVSPGRIVVHPFVNVTAVKAASVKIFVSDVTIGVVNIYHPNGTLIAQLTGFNEPQGLATDAKGNLYVADTGNSRIQIYAPPYTGSPTTLSDPGEYPAGVSVLNNGKFVAVTNVMDTSGGQGSVILYTNGTAGSPIFNSDFLEVYLCGFDAKGNLYVDGSNSFGAVEVGEIAKLTTGGTTLTTLAYNNAISFPGGVEVTTKGEIAIGDQLGAAIYSYNPPKGGSLGSPVETTPLTGSSDVVTFAFKKYNKFLWTADAVNADSNKFAYPGGGSALRTIPVTGGPVGVAIVPAQVP
jgi:hypothetical protein